MTHYELLGVPPNASLDDLHRAYRRAVRRYHPDVNPAAGAAQYTARLNAAWETLSDARTRAAYDRHLRGFPEAEAATAWQPHPNDFRPSPRSAYALSRTQRYAAVVYAGLCFALLFAFIASAVHWVPLVVVICGALLVARVLGRSTG